MYCYALKHDNEQVEECRVGKAVSASGYTVFSSADANIIIANVGDGYGVNHEKLEVILRYSATCCD